MKPNHFTLLPYLFFLSLMLMISCGQDEVTPVEQPMGVQILPTFLEKAGLTKELTTSQEGHEIGFCFIPKEDGDITHLTVRLPYPDSKMRITLWNKDTGDILLTKYVGFIPLEEELVIAITPYRIFKQGNYILSFDCGKDVYLHRKPDSSSYLATVAGDILVIGAMERAGLENGAQLMPDQFNLNQFYGDVSFLFKKVE